MKIKRFVRFGGLAACAVLALGLAACTGDDVNVSQTHAADDLFICYSYGDDYDGAIRVFSKDGKLLTKTDPSNNENIWLVTDRANKQAGFAVVTSTYSDDEFDKWGSPLLIGTNYRVFNADGNEVSNATIQNPGSVNMLTPSGADGDIFYFNFVDREESADGVPYYELYDKMGEVIMTDPLQSNLEDEDTAYAYADYNGKLLAIHLDAWNSDWSEHWQQCDIYARQTEGEPFAVKELGKHYQNISIMYNENGYDSSYWQAEYYPTTGTAMFDILNDDGTVAIEGLNELLNIGSGMVFARVGNERVLMDMQGKRLYSESIFNSLND